MIPKAIAFISQKKIEAQSSLDMIVLPFWKGKKKAEYAGAVDALKKYSDVPIELGDFLGSLSETFIVYTPGKPSRILLLGLGKREEATQELLRRAYGSVAKICHKHKCRSIGVVLPKAKLAKSESIARGLSEGLLLANYAFTALRRHSLELMNPTLIETVSLIGADKEELHTAQACAKIAQGVYLARNLSNGNADDVTPVFLAHMAKEIAKKQPKIKTTIFDRKRITKEGMGLLLAVNRGSTQEPAFILLDYKGAPTSKDHTVIVGKGITYDTGGLSLKTSDNMSTMKSDMSGAAAVLGTFLAVASLGLKINITGVIPATENCINAHSYKPGDVYVSFSGKSIEVNNTDAEGRLVLADGLAYAVKELKPTRIIDIATLTGSIEVALGNETTGMFSNDEFLAEAFSKAGKATYERVWRMPLFDEYRDQLRSDIADMRNIGGRLGGSITAAKFLQEFVEETPWVHFDIAGTAFLSDSKRYHPKHATGVGVRLLIEFFQNLRNSK